MSSLGFKVTGSKWDYIWDRVVVEEHRADEINPSKVKPMNGIGSAELKTGGKVNYYLAQIDWPRREDQRPYQAECEDIIEALAMTFDEGCAFKAIWRSAAARLGEQKVGHDAIYDAEKIVHYGYNILGTAKRKTKS